MSAADRGAESYQSTDGGRIVEESDVPGLAARHDGTHRARRICKRSECDYAQIEVAPDKEPASPAARDSADRPRRAEAPGAAAAPPPPNPQTSGVWRSNDKGRSWMFMSNENQRPMYFSQIRVDPNNP